MKKLSKMLALGLALALTMGMTVLADESPNGSSVFKDAATEAAYAKEAETLKQSAKSVLLDRGKDGTTALTVGAADAAALFTAQNIKLTYMRQAFGTDVTSAVIVAAFSVEATLPASTRLVFNISGVTTGKSYAFLHLKSDGKWEVIPAKVEANGQLSGAFTSLSPIFVVEYTKSGSSSGATSPKTGETFPVAGTLAVVFAAGALVCTTKRRSGK